MAPNYEIFNQPLATLFAKAGIPTAPSKIEHYMHFKQERTFDKSHSTIVVNRSIMRDMEPRCIEHICRKNRGDNYEKPLREQTVVKADVCCFRFGAFDNDFSKVSISEGHSYAQSILYWLLHNAENIPIVVETTEEERYSPWRFNTFYPAMSERFRKDNLDMLVSLMNCMDRLTILGEAVKVTHGMYVEQMMTSSFEPSQFPSTQFWNLNGKTYSSRDLLSEYGLVNEANLLAICWKMLETAHRREESGML